MPNILPVSDLRNYNEVLKNCQSGEPVFLTKNGRGRFVLIDIEDYEEMSTILQENQFDASIKICNHCAFGDDWE